MTIPVPTINELTEKEQIRQRLRDETQRVQQTKEEQGNITPTTQDIIKAKRILQHNSAIFHVSINNVY